MKNKSPNKKNFLSKFFVKLVRKFGFELIDQAEMHIPTSDLNANENLSKGGIKSVTVPLGVTEITNKVESITIIIRSYTFGNTNTNQVMLDQSKKRIFDLPKIDYTLRTINSVIKSCALAKEYFKDLKINLVITDDQSTEENLLRIDIIVEGCGIFMQK